MWPLLLAGLLVGAVPQRATLRLEIAPDAALSRELLAAQLELRLVPVVQLSDAAVADFVLQVGRDGFGLQARDGTLLVERHSAEDVLPEIEARELALAVEAELRVQLAWSEPPPTVTLPPPEPPPPPAPPGPTAEVGVLGVGVWTPGAAKPEVGVRARLAGRQGLVRLATGVGWTRAGDDAERQELRLAGGLELAWPLGRTEVLIGAGVGALAARAAVERAVTTWHALVAGGLAVRIELGAALGVRVGAGLDTLVRPPEYVVDGAPVVSPGRFRAALEVGLAVDL